MALHDYRCPVCHEVLRDVFRTAAQGAQSDPPTCHRCDRPMAWIPNVGFIDAKEPFQAFDTYDGRNRPVHIDSLRKLRQVERESEQQARDGVGQPMVWRRYSQGESNRDQGVFGPPPSVQPDPAFLERQKIRPLRGVDPDTATYGPGVSDQNTSALPEP